jgi:hypothetical protein
MTTTKNTTSLTDSQIAAYEAKGAKRWIKRDMDRLYIDTKLLGLEVSYYKTGNVSDAKWCGEHISNADGRRFMASKVFVDVKTGELVVQDKSNWTWSYYEVPSIEDKAREFVAEVEASMVEAEPAKSEKTKAEERREELVQVVQDFIAERIEVAKGLPENRRAHGIARLKTVASKTIDAIRNLPDEYVMYQKLDGNWLVQPYAFC